MGYLRFRLTALLPVVFLAVMVGPAGAQSPDRALWDTFFDRPLREAVVPEDETLGLLANLRSPDPAWGGAIDVCEQAFIALSGGEVPRETLSPDLALPLRLALEAALGETGRLDAVRRYGRPERSGNRVTVPVRLGDSERAEYGHI